MITVVGGRSCSFQHLSIIHLPIIERFELQRFRVTVLETQKSSTGQIRLVTHCFHFSSIDMSVNINSLRLPELRENLKARGVTITGYNKAALKDIALSVNAFNLPVDPDYQQDSVLHDIKGKLKRAGLPDKIHWK